MNNSNLTHEGEKDNSIIKKQAGKIRIEPN